MGAYERQAGTLRVTQDTLRATFANMQQIIGTTLLPVVADLTASLIPLVETLGPVLASAFRQVVPLLVSFTTNSEGIINTFVTFVKIIAGTVSGLVFLGKIIIQNIELLKNIAIVIGIVATALYSLRIGFAVFTGLRSFAQAFNVTLGLTATGVRLVGIAMAAIPVLGWIAAAGAIAGLALDISHQAKVAADNIEDMLDVEALLSGAEDFAALNEEIGNTGAAFEEVTEASGQAKDAIGDFYRKLADEIDKQQAKLRLQQMGASEGLIQSILGSGEDWQRVFNDVVSRGIAGVADVQRLFQATAAGFDEAMSQWEEEYGEPFRQFRDDALAARDALVEFTREIEILPSIAETLGEFERSAVDNLASIEEKLKEAFDNGQLLDGSYRNLLAYARDEFQVLRQIERQRDDIMGRRNAAEALINSVQSSIQSGARLVGILDTVNTSAEGVDIVEFATRTVSAGTSLQEFRTALLYNFVEPIEKATSRADELVSGYRAVVDRTREFVENLKALRALGLDPMLFNQLVEAGVEAGGETARALVEGGSDTVTEVNSLFSELDALGQELGENTAQVMYGQGENFVNGIVEGLEAQAGELEISAKSIAEAFTTAFEEVLTQGINQAIDAAEAALARMPKVGDYAPSFAPPTGGGGGDGGGAPAPSGPRPPLLPTPPPPSLLELGLSGQVGRAPTVLERGLSGAFASAPARGSFGPETLSRSLNQNTGSIVNIYTSSSTRETQNQITRANSRSGAPVTTSVRALENWRVG